MFVINNVLGMMFLRLKKVQRSYRFQFILFVCEKIGVRSIIFKLFVSLLDSIGSYFHFHFITLKLNYKIFNTHVPLV